MKNLYGVVVIENAVNLSPEEYIEIYANATPHICEGVQAVFDYCGGKLCRGSCGYGGMIGGKSCYAFKINRGR